MAQHDYVIANGTGAAVRSDLNNALAAIVSNNSGATEPATMYAYQWWADTSTGLLKLRNAANNAWITLRELDGTLTIEDGTASSPGLAFADDLNTGIYSPSADQLGITTGGTVRLTTTTTGITSALPVDVPLGTASAPTVTFTGDLNTGIYSPGADQVAITTNGVERVEWGTSEVVFNDGGANYDFRIEGDTNSSLFFVDASAEAVGIGTTSPGNALVVSNSGAQGFEVQKNSGLLSGGIELISYNRTTSAYAPVLYDASFHAFGISNSEKARIDSSGRLLVGTSTSEGFGGKLQVRDDSGLNCEFFRSNATSTGPTFALNKSRGSAGSPTIVNTGDILSYIVGKGYDGSAYQEAASVKVEVDGTPGANDMPGRLVFSTTADGAASPTERMRITNNGNVFINSTTNPAVGIEMFGVAAQGSGQTIAAGFASTVNTDPTVFVVNGSNTTNTFLMRFASGSGGNTRGEIYYNGSQLVYATSSDYRLKENVIDFDDGIEIVKQLRPVRYNWIENGNGDIGFIAHEVQAVFPNAVGGEKDAVDEDGKILPQTYDPSKLVPLLTAALQEAIGRIEALEAEVATLKAA